MLKEIFPQYETTVVFSIAGLAIANEEDTFDRLCSGCLLTHMSPVFLNVFVNYARKCVCEISKANMVITEPSQNVYILRS